MTEYGIDHSIDYFRLVKHLYFEVRQENVSVTSSVTTPFVYGGRVLAYGVLEDIMTQFPLFQINCWVMVVAKYLQVEEKMV